MTNIKTNMGWLICKKWKTTKKSKQRLEHGALAVLREEALQRINTEYHRYRRIASRHLVRGGGGHCVMCSLDVIYEEGFKRQPIRCFWTSEPLLDNQSEPSSIFNGSWNLIGCCDAGGGGASVYSSIIAEHQLNEKMLQLLFNDTNLCYSNINCI